LNLSRRRFVVGAGTAAAAASLAACGGASNPVPSDANTVYDLIVVGAGVSGIGAAKTAQSYGAKVLVLEAQPHIGGRTFTDTTTFSEIGFDLGAQFFQQCIAGNELWQIAQAQGLTLLPSAGKAPPAGLGSGFMSGTAIATPSQVSDFLATTLAIKSAIFSQGLAIAGGAPDVSVRSVVSPYSSLPWYDAAVSQAATELMGSLDRSDLDLYDFMTVQFAPFVTPGDDYVVRTGVGTFVANLAKGLNIQTNTPVTAIATTPASVTVQTATGKSFSSKTIIVTASTAVLASGGIAFTPALPAAYTAAFAGLPLANVYKCLMGLSGPRLNVPDSAFGTNFGVVLPLVAGDSAAIFPNFWNTNTVEFIANGALALDLETGGPAHAAQVLMAQLQTHFPGATWDGRITGSTWTTNPYTKGAYSGALVGQVPVRTLLQQPISNQLWFAGEAINASGSRGVIQGAYRSGIAAATAAMKAAGLAAVGGA
jgi:monoamine oxidase